MSLDDNVRKQISDLVTGHDVVVFMKGNKQFPQCGFSAQVVSILDGLGAKYHTVNVLTDAPLRDGIKEFSSWPTIPQVFVRGEFIGGCDIVKELHARGELGKMVGGDARAPIALPAIRLTDDAAKAIRAAMEEGGDLLRFEIDAQFKYELYFGPRAPDDVEVQANGVTILLDPASARRANDTSIAYVDGPNGGFKITNPNEPATVKQLTAAELKAMIDRGEKFELLDVRNEAERKIATLPGARLFDEKTRGEVDQLDRSTALVFHCHHGGRSQAAAQAYLSKGFKKVFNLRGGIDAWSSTVDPSVPRY